MTKLTKCNHLRKLTDQGYEWVFDPLGQGSCQLRAWAYFLRVLPF